MLSAGSCQEGNPPCDSEKWLDTPDKTHLHVQWLLIYQRCEECQAKVVNAFFAADLRSSQVGWSKHEEREDGVTRAAVEEALNTLCRRKAHDVRGSRKYERTEGARRACSHL